MSRDISQAAPSSSDVHVGLKEPPKRRGSVRYSADTDYCSMANRLEHPAAGSRSAPLSRQADVSNLGIDNGRWSGAQWGSSSRNVSLARVGYENIGFEDEPTPRSNIEEQIDFSMVFGNVDGMRQKALPAFHDENPGQVLSKWQGREQKRRVPEQRITLFAFRLAMMEKTASTIGTMAFLWATVVILAGFDITFENFCVVTAIIVAEGARIFNRSHEFEWQNISTKTREGGMITSMIKSASDRLWKASPTSDNQTSANNVTDLEAADTHDSPAANTTLNSKTDKKRLMRRARIGKGFERPLQERLGPVGGDGPKSRRTWARRDIPILPFVSNVLTSRAMSLILYVAQIISALLCIGLSFWQLAKQKFCSDCDDEDQRVLVSMNLFYAMAVVEAGLFLLEKGYLEYRMRYRDLLAEVRNEVFEGKLGDEFSKILWSFYNAVYSQCIKGSVFDGLDMDLVGFGIQWLQSEHFPQQLYGAKLLNHFVQGNFTRDYHKDALIADALRRLGTTPGVIERLVEMLSWNSQEEEELLYEIASIIRGLVAYDRNCSRLVAVPGALDAIVSLLMPHGDIKSAPTVAGKVMNLRLTGLRILNFLCRTHKNSQKIGETKGLLSILVIFIQVFKGAPQGQMPQCLETDGELEWKVHKRSLQILFLLAAATNTSGETLRQKIAAIVSGLKNLRDIIAECDERPDLQLLSMKILHHLALEDNVRSSIGATSGTILLLFRIFQRNDTMRSKCHDDRTRQDQMAAVEQAGQVLSRLVLQNESNCLRLLNLKEQDGAKPVVDVMLSSLRRQESIATSAAEILRSVLKYADESTRVRISVACAPIMLQNLFGEQVDSKSRLYQVSLGLASRAAASMPIAKYRKELGQMDKGKFVSQLIRNLHHTPTTNKFPSIRRYSVEFILALIEKDDYFLEAFAMHNKDLKDALERALNAISEVENYILFSGLMGYARQSEDMEHLVTRCIEAVNHYNSRSRLNPTSPLMEEALS